MTRRILHVITGLDAAGAEISLARVAARLDPLRWTCAVAALGGDGPAGDDIRRAGIDVRALGGAGWASAARTAAGLLRAARGFRPDLVHGWMYHGNLAATLVTSRPSRPRLVWGIRQGLYDYGASPRGTRAAIRLGALLSRVPDRILYNAASAARQHEAFGYRAEATRIVPNGYDLEAFRSPDGTRERLRNGLGIGAADEVIALVARWHPVKNHAGFAAAAALLAGRRPSARFLLCGRGITEGNEDLVGTLRAAGVADRCLLLGERRDLVEILRVADVATLSSSGEAFPNALAEAMASGVPCVAPRVGDVEELVGPTGVVVEPGNPEALAAGWETILSMDNERRRESGAAARERIRSRYSIEQSVAALEAVYSELLEA